MASGTKPPGEWFWGSFAAGSQTGACFNTTFGAPLTDGTTFCAGGGAVSQTQCTREFGGDYAPSLTCPQLGYTSMCSNPSVLLQGSPHADLVQTFLYGRVFANGRTHGTSRVPTCSTSITPACTFEGFSAADVSSATHVNCPCFTGDTGVSGTAVSWGACPQTANGHPGVCDAGVCSAPAGAPDGECATSADCGQRQYCVATVKDGRYTGVCAAAKGCVPRGSSASSKGKCEFNEVCVLPTTAPVDEDDGVCSPGCRTDADCDTPDANGRTFCSQAAGMCVSVECRADADCPDDKPTCAKDSMTCVRPCGNDTVCGPGEACSQSEPFVCGAVCLDTDGCAAGQTCNGGVCVSGCTTDADCSRTAGTPVCRYGKCASGCSGDGDCPDTSYCGSGGVCTAYQRSSSRGRTKLTSKKWFWPAVGGAALLLLIIIVAAVAAKHHAAATQLADQDAAQYADSGGAPPPQYM